MTQHISHGGVIVRRASIADVEAIMDLAKNAPTSSRWARTTYATYCAAERQQDGISSATALFVAKVPSVHPEPLIGFAAFSAVTVADHAECELGNMAVAEEWRRQGIGRRLLMAGFLWCSTLRSASDLSGEADFRPREGKLPEMDFWLEVRASNQTAIAFYESVGFRVSGRRTGYYEQPTEDAVLMAVALRDVVFAC